ncbi:MAG: DUF692 domain-containing protein [Thiobacillus sp.]|nr:DUF692 domain-containing protein [Thiobacillus sp.]
MQMPKLGVGVVYVPGLEPLLHSGNTCVQVIEVEPQTLWQLVSEKPRRYALPPQALTALNRLPQPKIIHSVGFAVGGAQPPEPAFLEALIETAEVLDAGWVSEHLSVTHVHSNNRVFHTGFMLPPLQTVDGALCAAHTMSILAKQLPVPFAVETSVNYLRPRSGELSDGRFVAMAVEKADCGILLDLHNIWTNERNGRQNVRAFLKEIPLDRVWEVHVGGGFEFEGYWLDAHSGVVPEPVLELLEEVLPTLPNVRALVYEIFPSFVPLFGLDGIEHQLERLKGIWDQCTWPPNDEILEMPAHPAFISTRDLHVEITPELWEATLGELVTSGSIEGTLAAELKQDPAVPLIGTLIWKFRAGAIVKVLGALTKLVLLHSGQKRFEQLLDGYFRMSKPTSFASQEAKGFICYLRAQNLDIPYLPDILRYEEAAIESAIMQKVQCVPFSCDPIQLLQALIDGHLPDNVESGVYELEIAPDPA